MCVAHEATRWLCHQGLSWHHLASGGQMVTRKAAQTTFRFGVEYIISLSLFLYTTLLIQRFNALGPWRGCQGWCRGPSTGKALDVPPTIPLSQISLTMLLFPPQNSMGQQFCVVCVATRLQASTMACTPARAARYVSSAVW